jgi:nicotinamide-nucleotide amidase
VLTDRPGESDKAEQVMKRLQARAWRVAVAESATGGLLGHQLTKLSGSSAVFWGGVLAYSNEVKSRLLGVREESLVRWGAVSAQVAMEMAQGARTAVGVEVALSTTGIAGPTGATAYKPLGLYYIGVALPGETWCWRHVFSEDRQANNQLAVQAALEHLLMVMA